MMRMDWWRIITGVLGVKKGGFEQEDTQFFVPATTAPHPRKDQRKSSQCTYSALLFICVNRYDI
jgi:hypothetical protein